MNIAWSRDMDGIVGTHRVTTRATDEIALRVHILPTLGDVQIAKVRPPHIHALVAEWTAAAAPRTVRRQYGTLRAMFAFAVECDWLSRTPCRAVKLPSVTSTHRHALTPNEVAAIAEATQPRYRLMVWLGAVLGLRWSEVAGLRVGRIDFLQRTLTVAEAVTRDAKGVPVLSPPKSDAGFRTLAMPPALADLLAEHMVACDLSASDGGRFLFETRTRQPLRYSNWRRSVWVPAVTAASRPAAGFHDLRRASATALVNRGIDIRLFKRDWDTRTHASLCRSMPRSSTKPKLGQPISSVNTFCRRRGQRYDASSRAPGRFQPIRPNSPTGAV